MGDKTGIQWTDATWNPIRGCRRTAPKGSKQSGCGDPTGGGCYAERTAYRFCGEGEPYDGLVELTANGPRWTGKVRFVRGHLLDPLRWRRPRRIFTDSMSDLFFEGVETWMVDEIVAVMMICCLHEKRGGHIFQTLTKRPRRMREYFTDPNTQERVARAAAALMEDGAGWFDAIALREEGLLHPRMWWGTTVENQPAAAERIPELLATPAAFRFLSVEPMIGPVDLLPWLDPTGACCGTSELQCEGCPARAPWRRTGPEGEAPSLDWIIIGCESGPRARPMEARWAHNLVEQCQRYGVPPFLKQAMVQNLDREEVDGEFVDPIAIGPGSEDKGRGLIGLPYLYGAQHATIPEVPHG